MKLVRNFGIRRLGVMMLAGLFSAASLAELPGGEYACQVVTEGGGIGMVLVQADDRQVARQAALGASAYIDKKNRARATKVVECIRRPQEKFSDYQVQQFFESMPR